MASRSAARSSPSARPEPVDDRDSSREPSPYPTQRECRAADGSRSELHARRAQGEPADREDRRTGRLPRSAPVVAGRTAARAGNPDAHLDPRTVDRSSPIANVSRRRTTTGATIAVSAAQAEEQRRAECRSTRQREQEQQCVVRQDHRDVRCRAVRAPRRARRSSPARTRMREARGLQLSPSPAASRPLRIAIETPARVAKRIDERPFTTSSQVDGSPQSQGCVIPT